MSPNPKGALHSMDFQLWFAAIEAQQQSRVWAVGRELPFSRPCNLHKPFALRKLAQATCNRRSERESSGESAKASLRTNCLLAWHATTSYQHSAMHLQGNPSRETCFDRWRRMQKAHVALGYCFRHSYLDIGLPESGSRLNPARGVTNALFATRTRFGRAGRPATENPFWNSGRPSFIHLDSCQNPAPVWGSAVLLTASCPLLLGSRKRTCKLRQ